MLTTDSWENASKSAFWSSNLDKQAWQEAIRTGNANILETSLEWMKPSVFIRHFGAEEYADTWPALRLPVRDIKLFSGVNLGRRRAYYDAWWSRLVCGRCWLYPAIGWLDLAPEKALLLEMAKNIYTPAEAEEACSRFNLPINTLATFLDMGFFRVLDMPLAFGTSVTKAVYFPVKPDTGQI